MRTRGNAGMRMEFKEMVTVHAWLNQRETNTGKLLAQPNDKALSHG